jgi:hypothetical protein
LRSLREKAEERGPCNVVVVSNVVVSVGSLARRRLGGGVYIVGTLHLCLVLLLPFHSPKKREKNAYLLNKKLKFGGACDDELLATLKSSSFSVYLMI